MLYNCNVNVNVNTHHFQSLRVHAGFPKGNQGLRLLPGQGLPVLPEECATYISFNTRERSETL